MSDLLRLYALRSPEPVAKNDLSKVGIETHPERFRSENFKKLLELCRRGVYQPVKDEMVKFFAGRDAVLSDAAYKPSIGKFLSECVAHGKNLSAAHVTEAARRHKTDKTSLSDAIQRTADTLLAATFLRRTAEVSTSLQDNLRVLLYRDHLESTKAALPFRNFTERPFFLPPCFFALDPCKQIITVVDSAAVAPGKAAIAKREPATVVRSDSKDTPRAGDTQQQSDSPVPPLPPKDPCNCKPDKHECVDQNKCCARLFPFPVDLMVVREEVKCYRPGELSYIENILMGENRVRNHRHLERTEDYTETEKTTTTYEEHDHQVTERFALKKEIEETVKQDFSIDAGVTYNAKWGKAVEQSLTATVDASYSQTKETAKKEAQDYSREVVNRSISKVEQKLREFVSQKRIVETEETNEHGFNNKKGKDNIAGQYFYVNKVSRAQVFNHGRRLAFDIYLPEPAELYKKLLEKQFGIEEPEIPKLEETDTPLKPTDITDKNYLQLLLDNDIREFDFPPKFTDTVSVKFNNDAGAHGSTDITIPGGFQAVSLELYKVEEDIRWADDDNPNGSIVFQLGKKWVQILEDGSSVTSSTFDPQLPEGSQQIENWATDVEHYNVCVVVHCELKPELKLKWQLSIYNKIMEAYEKKKKAYDEALAEFERTKQEKRQRNPFINREIERAELKRMAISYISCQFFDEMDAMKPKVKPCGHAQMDLPETEKEGAFVRFFEQVFDWNFMTYLFYPYYWGRKYTWDEKMKEEADDLLFEQFLKAGFARVQVPVREGFEAQALYWSAFHDIWLGNDIPPLPGDNYYLSMAQEVKEQKGNFYTDRPGVLKVTSGSDEVTLTGTDFYWFIDPNTGAGSLDTIRINADFDREIYINFKVYRVISITEDTSDPNHKTWKIKLERPYEGADAANLKYSMGAVFVGAPWEFITPTKAVWLRGLHACLPCFPLDECKD